MQRVQCACSGRPVTRLIPLTAIYKAVLRSYLKDMSVAQQDVLRRQFL